MVDFMIITFKVQGKLVLIDSLDKALVSKHKDPVCANP
jgi:hypothetical protein